MKERESARARVRKKEREREREKVVLTVIQSVNSVFSVHPEFPNDRVGVCRPLLIVYRAVVGVCRALLIVHRARAGVCRAPLRVYGVCCKWVQGS